MLPPEGEMIMTRFSLSRNDSVCEKFCTTSDSVCSSTHHFGYYYCCFICIMMSLPPQLIMGLGSRSAIRLSAHECRAKARRGTTQNCRSRQVKMESIETYSNQVDFSVRVLSYSSTMHITPGKPADLPTLLPAAVSIGADETANLSLV